MGGYGSTRWNSHSKKYTVEDGYVLKMKIIHASLRTRWSGTITWSRNEEKVASIDYQVVTAENEPSAIRLIYRWNSGHFSDLIKLSSTPLPWGGKRYWFNCPNPSCGR